MTAAVRAVFFALLLSLTALASARDFTPEEQRQRDEAIADLAQTCRERLRPALKPQGRQPAVDRWVATALDPDKLCGCMENEIKPLFTPEVLDRDSEEEGRRLGEQAASTCLITRIQRTFGDFCADATMAVVGGEITSEHDRAVTATYCGCMQGRIDTLTAATLFPFLRNTSAVSKQSAESQKLPAGGNDSMLAMMMACGAPELKSRLAEDDP